MLHSSHGTGTHKNRVKQRNKSEFGSAAWAQVVGGINMGYGLYPVGTRELLKALVPASDGIRSALWRAML